MREEYRTQYQPKHQQEKTSKSENEIEKAKTIPFLDDFDKDRKSTRLNSSHDVISRMPSSA